jgi:hypothetical protein
LVGAEVNVQGVDGKQVPLTSLFAQRRIVLSFVRQFA